MFATAYAIPDVLVFAGAALLIITGALGVIVMKNPVHSALSLILALLGVAVAFLAQNADFLAAVEIIVYAGAIVVLFLFVIMFLGVDKSNHPYVEPLVGQRWLAALGVLVTMSGIITLMASSHWVSGVLSSSTGGVALATGAGNVTQLGDSVFTTYLLSFEATSGLLIIAVVGAVLLARRERPADSDVDVDVDIDVDIDGTGRVGGGEVSEGEWWVVNERTSEEVES
ncbi:MAG: NADH-quinone oxidoreductase subunit J [Acidobacteria bacterium]|nr:NADH-quinone oxidoreductase subunit J [Acidobacteriota bacterium]